MLEESGAESFEWTDIADRKGYYAKLAQEFYETVC
jgi:hypothetical protein